MFKRLLCLTIAAAATLTAMPRPDNDEHKEHGKDHKREGKEWKRDEQEDRRYWKDHDKREENYWKEREKESHTYRQHHYYGGDYRGHESGRRPVAPPWMNDYWHSGETRRYVALVPGDPSRMYVFLDGRWVLRQVRDPRARVDVEGAFRLPVAPPPIAPPRIGVDLHVVLFN